MIVETAVVLLCAATAVLLWHTYMDVRYFLLPDIGNIILAGLGLLYRLIHVQWADASDIAFVLGDMALGAGCGAAIFLGTRWLSLKWKGVEGVGLGDVKFSAAAGIWLGAGGVGLMIGGASVLLLAFGCVVVALTRRSLRDYYLPFGAAAAPVTIILLWLGFFGKLPI
jgi:leader peptidase (prepilin peptidase)/N-methyltransferase